MKKSLIAHRAAFLSVLELSLSDRYAIVELVSPFRKGEDHFTATDICKHVFLNGYCYAEMGTDGLYDQFEHMLNEKCSCGIHGFDICCFDNKFECFLARKTIASEFFQLGIKFYEKSKFSK